MRSLLLAAGCFLIPFAGAQPTAASVNTNGNFTYRRTRKVESGTLTTGSATPFPVELAPLGPGPEGDPSLVNCTSCSQPVTISNGNMFHQFADLALNSRGFPLALTRTYNSESGADGMFGIGWTNTYQRWLDPGAGSIVYYNGSGGAYTFNAQSAGYTSPPGLNLTLTTTPSGYAIQTAHGALMNFDSTGRLVSLADSDGNTQTLSYNSSGIPASVSDSIGDALNFSYDSNNHVTQVQDTTGRTVLYSYDQSGNLISSTDPTSARTTYSYLPASSGGYLQAITFADGGTITYQYDANHRASQVTDRGGAQDSFAYTPPSAVTVLTDELGNATTFQYNSTGNTTRKVQPDGTSTAATWDANSEPLTFTDESGNQTKLQNDAKGNLLNATNPLGGGFQYAYDPVFNKITSFKDADGNASQYTYDSKGNLLSSVDPLGNATTLSYDSYGNPLAVTDPDGNTASIVWDSHNNPVTISDSLGHSTEITYDRVGRPLTITPPLHGAYTRSYDALGRVLKSTNPLAESHTYVYDGVGNLTSENDANGNTTAFVSDHLGNLTKVTDPAGNVTSYAYSPGSCKGCGAAGTLSSITNAAGETSSLTYNSNMYVASATDPLKNVTQFTYDPTGNLSKVTDRNGASVSYAYDALHRLTKRTLPDGTGDTFTYDANGNILTAANQNVTLSFIYDALNRIASMADSRFPAPVTYTYDAAGRRTSMTDPFGGQTTYMYDANGRLAMLGSPDGSLTQYTTFRYDASGRRTRIGMGNGVTGDYQYDGADEVTSLTYFGGVSRDGQAGLAAGPILAQFSYTYDRAGNRASLSTPSGRRSFQYDPLYELTGVSGNGAPEIYTYDAAGNRTSSNGQFMRYDAAGRLTSFGSASYSYDKNGNLIALLNSQGTTAFSYDGLNRLTGVTPPNGVAVAFKYDPFGRRIEKDSAGAATMYLNDGDNVLLEQTGGGQFSARYAYGPGVDQPVIMERGGASYYYLSDASGNVTGLTDGSGTVVQSYTLDSFGNVVSATGALQNPYIFAGRALDEETGLYYFRNRYYDPTTGRFTTQDPFSPAALLAAVRIGSNSAGAILWPNLQSPLALNPYAYAVNNPAVLKDPYGASFDTANNAIQATVGAIVSNASTPPPVNGQTVDFVLSTLLPPPRTYADPGVAAICTGKGATGAAQGGLNAGSGEDLAHD